MVQVTLRGVTKRWGSFVGVSAVDLAIADREFIVLLGPSGCGKTTTMRMIAGLEDPTEGEIVIGDRVVNRLEPKDRDIAMVFQNYGLYPNLTVYENIRFPLKVRRIDPATHDARVRRAAAMVELGDLLARRPRELSGGQRHRLHLVMGDIDRGDLKLMLKILDLRPRGHPQLGIQVRQRFVHQEHGGLAHDRPRQLAWHTRFSALAHTFGSHSK